MLRNRFSKNSDTVCCTPSAPPHSSTQIRSARALGPFPVALAAPPYGACRRAASTAKHRGARAKTAKACDKPAHTTNILHTARPPQEPIICEAPSRPLEICTSLILFPLTGKAHFSALNHGGNYEKIEDWRTRDAYCVRNGRLPGPRCLIKRAH